MRIKAGELSEDLRGIPGAKVPGGRAPVDLAGFIVGGIGIPGAPDPVIDGQSALAAIRAIADKLDF